MPKVISHTYSKTQSLLQKGKINARRCRGPRLEWPVLDRFPWRHRVQKKPGRAKKVLAQGFHKN